MSKEKDKTAQELHDQLIDKMEKTREKWKNEEEDDTDRLLNEAIEMSIAQGKGWADGEKEEYMKKLLDDDYIPAIFAENQEELARSGMAEAFSSLVYDEPPSRLMQQFKQKGNEAFANGKRNQAKNVQYYRDAINHYYESFAWAQKTEPIRDGDNAQADTPDELIFHEEELDAFKSTVLGNAAMAHMMLKNWGHVRDDSKKALIYNDRNIKAWYRLAKAYQMLQKWEEAGDAIEKGLAVENENKDLLKLQKLLAEKVRKARLARQQRERRRAERVSRVKEVWKWCKERGIRLGRVPLVASVTDDEDGDNDDHVEESRWHHHHPHTGKLPEHMPNGDWAWPCMFIYPSHKQSDYVEHFVESDVLALQMAQVFPELEDGENETRVPWDYNDEFVCSNLAVYFEVHRVDEGIVHPENVELLKDQAGTMRFYESSRALKGDEGSDMASLARAMERKHLHKQRKTWKKKHGSLWTKPPPNTLVRVHPAMMLKDILSDKRMVVPNFLVTFIMFPENHPAHDEYLKEHRCVGILQPES